MQKLADSMLIEHRLCSEVFYCEPEAIREMDSYDVQIHWSIFKAYEAERKRRADRERKEMKHK